jgi:hypothetical protein
MNILRGTQTALAAGAVAFAVSATETPVVFCTVFVLASAAWCGVTWLVDRYTDWTRLLNGVALVLLVPAYIDASVSRAAGALAVALLVPRYASHPVSVPTASLGAAIGALLARLAHDEFAHGIAISVIGVVLALDGLRYSGTLDDAPVEGPRLFLAVATQVLAVCGSTSPDLMAPPLLAFAALAGTVLAVWPNLLAARSHPHTCLAVAVSITLVSQVFGVPYGDTVLAPCLLILYLAAPVWPSVVPKPPQQQPPINALGRVGSIVRAFYWSAWLAFCACGSVLAAKELRGALYLLPAMAYHVDAA